MWKKRNSNDQATRETNDLARTVVEQELRQQRIAIVSPGSGKQGKLLPEALLHQQQDESSGTPRIPDGHFSTFLDHSLSEEELYELMQEVEEEMMRSEEELLEEILELERFQQVEMDQQVAEFEEWEATMAMSDMDHEERVLCPVCWEGNLQKSTNDNTVTCPDEACSLRLETRLSLTELKDSLRLAFEEHAMQCNGNMVVENLPFSDYGDHLVGVCHTCGTTRRVAL